MFYNALYRLTIEVHFVLRWIAKIMAWVYGLTCLIYYVNANLNNLSFWTMKGPVLHFLAAYITMKGSVYVRNFVLKQIVIQAQTRRV